MTVKLLGTVLAASMALGSVILGTPRTRPIQAGFDSRVA